MRIGLASLVLVTLIGCADQLSEEVIPGPFTIAWRPLNDSFGLTFVYPGAPRDFRTTPRSLEAVISNNGRTEFVRFANIAAAEMFDYPAGSIIKFRVNESPTFDYTTNEILAPYDATTGTWPLETQSIGTIAGNLYGVATTGVCDAQSRNCIKLNLMDPNVSYQFWHLGDSLKSLLANNYWLSYGIRNSDGMLVEQHISESVTETIELGIQLTSKDISETDTVAGYFSHDGTQVSGFVFTDKYLYMVTKTTNVGVEPIYEITVHDSTAKAVYFDGIYVPAEADKSGTYTIAVGDERRIIPTYFGCPILSSDGNRLAGHLVQDGAFAVLEWDGTKYAPIPGNMSNIENIAISCKYGSRWTKTTIKGSSTYSLVFDMVANAYPMGGDAQDGARVILDEHLNVIAITKDFTYLRKNSLVFSDASNNSGFELNISPMDIESSSLRARQYSQADICDSIFDYEILEPRSGVRVSIPICGSINALTAQLSCATSPENEDLRIGVSDGISFLAFSVQIPF